MSRLTKYIIFGAVLSLFICTSVFASELKMNKVEDDTNFQVDQLKILSKLKDIRRKIQPPKESITGLITSVGVNRYTVEIKTKDGRVISKNIDFNKETRFKINRKDLIRKSAPDKFEKRDGRSNGSVVKFSANSNNFKVGQTIRVIGTTIDDNLIKASLISQPPLLINK